MAHLTGEEFVLRRILRIAAAVMLGEAIVHFSGVRLSGAGAFWPHSAITYIYFFQALWASVSLFSAVFLWTIAKNIFLYKAFLRPLALFAVFHGFILFYFGMTRFMDPLPAPALRVWIPDYNIQLVLEAICLWLISGWVMYSLPKIKK